MNPQVLPSPPFIHLPGLPNFRSTGSHLLPPTPNLRTRPAYIYRSAAPASPPPSTIAALHGLRITKIYDLRSLPELGKYAARNPVLEIAGIERVFAPVFADEDYSPERIARRYQSYATSGTAGFVAAYADILAHAAAAYRVVFEHVRDRADAPFLLHCTAGKDRTGVLVALLLKVAGVADADVADEYALTEMGLAEEREAMVRVLVARTEMGGDEAGVRNLLGARRESMLATLAMVEEKYGGAEGYLKGTLGFTEGEVKRIRGNLVELA
jgi:hypothetical protein